ncbi:MAG: MBL fold metallo-hydrolase [Actinomycetota bacterium]|nr:MBL fold metallo-hydrolase [Actinomycetota bacterium]
MHAIGVHEDVIVVTSRIWQTTATAVRAGSEGFVIDSPVLPDELELLPAVLEQAHFPVAGLLCTHADWDHLLGRLAFPNAPVGTAETTAARLAGEPGAAQREMRGWDERHYVRRAGTLSLGQVQALPVPGYCAIGDRELELHPAEGHTAEGMAVWIPWAATLVCGDYLSPVEIPVVSAEGSIDAYRATLARLEPLITAAEAVVPGHGPVLDREGARRLLAEDVDYLEALAARGPEAPLPEARRGAEQRRIHAENVRRAAG